MSAATELNGAEELLRAQQLADYDERGWILEARNDGFIDVIPPVILRANFHIGDQPVKSARTLDEALAYINGVEHAVWWHELALRDSGRSKVRPNHIRFFASKGT